MESLLILFSVGLGMGAWTLICVRLGYSMGRETVNLPVHHYFSKDKDYEVAPEGADDPWSESQEPPPGVKSTVREQ